MEPNLDKLNFYTGANYMKRADISGNINISGSKDIDHELGYIPQFLHFEDLYGDGMLWYGGERVFEGTDSTAFFTSPPPLVDAWITTNTLTLVPQNWSGVKAAHWIIYLDYGA